MKMFSGQGLKWADNRYILNKITENGLEPGSAWRSTGLSQEGPQKAACGALLVTELSSRYDCPFVLCFLFTLVHETPKHLRLSLIHI